MNIMKDWLGTFWKVIVSPTPKTFLAEAQKAPDKFSSAMGWLVFFAIYLYGVVTIGIAPLPIAALISAVLLIPLVVILLTSAMHFVCQRVFHQKKYFYDKLLYITVAILLPIQFIFAPVTLFLPEKFSLALIYVLLLYQIVLLALALKTIANLEYWQALVTVFISVVVGILAFLCSIPFIMSTVGEGRSTVN
jgi:hypothetical protein